MSFPHPSTTSPCLVLARRHPKAPDGEDQWHHTKIVLSPTNRDYEPIVITGNAVESPQILAEFVAVLWQG